VTTGLVAAGEQSHVDEQSTGIIRSNQSRAAVVEGHVLVEERVVEAVEDHNAVRSQRHSVNSGHGQEVLIRHDLADRTGTNSGVGSRGGSVCGRVRHLGQHTIVAFCIDHASQAVPVAPFVLVAGNCEVRGQAGLNIPRWAQAHKHVLNGPLQLREKLLIRGVLVAALSVLTVHADEREANALDVNVVHLRVDEDVVDVQFHFLDRNVGDAVFLEEGRVRLRANSIIVNNGLKVETGELEGKQVLLSHLDSDEALAERDRHAGNRQPHIIVEPEAKLVPDLKRSLLGLGGLRPIDNLLQLARNISLSRASSVQSRVDRSGRRQVSRHIEEANRLVALARGELVDAGRGVGSISITGSGAAKPAVTSERHLLANEAVVPGALVGRRAELFEHCGNNRIILVKGVAVDIELHKREETVTGKLTVPNHVAVRNTGSASPVTGNNDVTTGINNIVEPVKRRASKHIFFLSGEGMGNSDNTGTGGGLSGRLSGVGGESAQARAADHVMEEVAKLGDAESNTATQDRVARLGAHLVVLVADSGKRLEVSVHVQDVSALEVHEGRRDVGLHCLPARAHHVLDALVKKLGSHDHSISFSVIRNELKDGPSGHLEFWLRELCSYVLKKRGM